MGAVRPIDDGVLEDDLVGGFDVRHVVAVLQPEAAELAGVELEQSGDRTRNVPEIVQRTSGEQRIYVVGTKLSVAHAKAPARLPLIDCLGVPAPMVIINGDT